MATSYKIEKHEFYKHGELGRSTDTVQYALYQWQKGGLFKRGYWRWIGEFDTVDDARRTMRALVKDAITSVEYYNQDGFQEYDGW